ncbi:hypothetical protein FB645_005463 [Coemansia sp. IMI 203386]|nr:hypothetical protein FB645_005463 [Coemansia sp. IMI 203386]
MSKYTLCIPGLGIASSDSIPGLNIEGLGFSQLVEKAAQNWDQKQHQQNNAGNSEQQHSCNTVWLDILLPSQTDIHALAAIFDIGAATLHRLLSNAAGEAINPECKAADTSLYLCWAETTTSTSGAAKYFSYGTIGHDEKGGDNKSVAAAESSTETAVTFATSETPDAVKGEARSGWIGGYFPVPPWLQPNATQVLSRLDLRKRPKKNKAGEIIATSQPDIESTRRQNMKHILSMLSRPMVVNKEQTWRVLKRWGPGHEQWWQEVLNSAGTKKPSLAETRLVAERLGREARALIGYQLVQVWMRGPVILTFRQTSSNAVTRVMAEAGVKQMRLQKLDPLAIVGGLAEHWVSNTQDCLDVLERYADRLDHDLTRPIESSSFEAASWSPVIARCRKAALALLRRCQIAETVLNQLCNASQSIVQSQFTNEAASGRTNRDGSGANNGLTRSALPRRLRIGDIAGYGVQRRLDVLSQQRVMAREARDEYRKTERRFSRLHTMLLDRQRLRLLSAQKYIHQYFRILVTVELVFLPIELWYNLDNLNGITTPGRLQLDINNDSDFWFTVMGIVVWAVLAILLYAIYTKFFERTPESLRLSNIASLERKRRRLQKQKQYQGPGSVGWLQKLFR